MAKLWEFLWAKGERCNRGATFPFRHERMPRDRIDPIGPSRILETDSMERAIHTVEPTKSWGDTTKKKKEDD
jgi:hypothetical protein